LCGLAAAPSRAAKVIRLFNPWGVDSTVFLGPHMDQGVSLLSFWPINFAKGADSSQMKVVRGTPWLEWTQKTALPSADVQFTRDDYTSYGSKGMGAGGGFDLSSYWAISDTAWIVPNPLPAGPATISATRPKMLTVFLWNPWEGSLRGAPSLQVQGGTWSSMRAVSGRPGWYSRTVVGATSADLLLRDSSGTSYLGPTGISPLPVSVNYDSAWKKRDSIWIVAMSEPKGPPKAFSDWPTPKVLLVFNPWDGSATIERPLVRFAGDTVRFPTRDRTDLCGWNERVWYDRPASVLVSSSSSGQTWGSTGLGSTGFIDLSGVLAKHDTVWLGRDASGNPAPSWTWDGTQGVCLLVNLAATIRDFNSSDSSFNNNGSCAGKGYVGPLLGPNRKPIPTLKIDKACEAGDSARIITDWFTTDPTYTRSAETCRDIPLQLQASTRNYTFADSNFYPIDDFDTLPNGKLNPFNVKYGGLDSKQHNFNFCLEMHGVFDYKTGQKFKFSGDDDVWFYIDGRLVVDLGGTHAAQTDSVNLDTMRLTAGKSYPWDMFYCERHAPGSSIQISTSMNLRTLPTFAVEDTVSATGRHDFSIWVNQKSGSSCASTTSRRLAIGKYTLTGGDLAAEQNLTTGTWYGGIVVSSDLGTASLDSASISGLTPGSYVLHVGLLGSDALTKDIPFTVPPPPVPHFTTPKSDTGTTGDVFPVQVYATLSGLYDSLPVPFHLVPSTGIAVFRDSLMTIPVNSTDTFSTGARGEPVRFWVRGGIPGAWNLVLRNRAGDSTDVRDFVLAAPIPKIPRYLDASPYAGTIGSAAPLDVMTTKSGKRFLDSTGFVIVPPSGLLMFRDSLLTDSLHATEVLHTGPAGETVRLWAKGVKIGSWNLVLRDAIGDSVDISPPLVFTGRGIRFTDANGSTGALGPVVADVHQWVAVHLESYIGDASCTVCRDSVTLSTENVHLRISATAGGAPVEGIRLVGGKAVVWIESDLPSDSTRIVAASDSAPYPIERAPIRILAPRLVFVDGAGREIVPSLVSFPVGGTATFHLEAWTSQGFCSACSDSLALSTANKRMLFLDAAGGESRRCALEGGKATVVSSSWAPFDSASFTATTDHLRASTSWRAVSSSLGAILASLTDSDADGRADRLSLDLPVDASVFAGLRVSWPDSAGRLESRSPSLPSSGRNLSLDLVPFPFAATSCPAQGCADLGSLEMSHGSDTALVAFPISDQVVPIIEAARLRYAWTQGAPDTVVAELSEPLRSTVGDADAWISWGRPSRDSLGRQLAPLSSSLSSDGKRLTFLVDTGFAPRPVDSVRLTASPSGAAIDTAGNRPLRFAHWTALDLGPVPPRLGLAAKPSMLEWSHWTIPPDEPALQALVRNSDGFWTTLSGAAPGQDTAHYLGALLKLNHAIHGQARVYDNMGVFVAALDLSALSQAIEQGQVPRDGRGNYQVWVGWNGKSEKGMASSGVYLLRVFGWMDTGESKAFVNQILRLGWSVPRL